MQRSQTARGGPNTTQQYLDRPCSSSHPRYRTRCCRDLLVRAPQHRRLGRRPRAQDRDHDSGLHRVIVIGRSVTAALLAALVVARWQQHRQVVERAPGRCRVRDKSERVAQSRAEHWSVACARIDRQWGAQRASIEHEHERALEQVHEHAHAVALGARRRAENRRAGRQARPRPAKRAVRDEAALAVHDRRHVVARRRRHGQRALEERGAVAHPPATAALFRHANVAAVAQPSTLPVAHTVRGARAVAKDRAARESPARDCARSVRDAHRAAGACVIKAQLKRVCGPERHAALAAHIVQYSSEEATRAYLHVMTACRRRSSATSSGRSASTVAGAWCGSFAPGKCWRAREAIQCHTAATSSTASERASSSCATSRALRNSSKCVAPASTISGAS
ncbi:hypothetical protein PybrP1_005546 [[Pythium] brassicae (nom. inval.)]|nr:hypothetical protein PybrP1_005546 [[Pythium] brassicae (nom. inval.)]